jgi:hypothetical protein
MARVRVDDLANSWRALVLGCGTFRDPAFVPLMSPGAEAESVVVALVDSTGIGMASEHVTLLTGTGVLRQDVMGALDQIVREPVPDRRLLLYFSGHGVRLEDDFGLVPHDTDSLNLRESVLLGTEIAKLLGEAKFSGVLVILDCCASAGFGEHAPDFFWKLDRADFRILLSSSREQQAAWESADGTGTVFSRHLKAVLRGQSAAGVRRGEITFAGLLDAIDVAMQEEARAVGEAPQEPVFAGVYPRDPLLFVHRASLVSGITIETSRVSRAYLRRVLWQTVVALLALLGFAAGTHVAWLEKHEYADTVAEHIVILKGFPGLNAWGYPKLRAELDYQPREMRDASPLRLGQPLVAALDRPAEPLVWDQLRDDLRGVRLLTDGKVAAARDLLLPLVRTIRPGAIPSESALGASLFFADVARSSDLPLLRTLLTAGRIETRTAAVRAILKLDVNEGLRPLTTDAPVRRAFQHSEVLAEVQASCSPGLSGYLAALLDAKDAHNIIHEVLDASLRLRCPPGDAGISRAIDVSTYGDARYVGLAIRVFRRAGFTVRFPVPLPKDSPTRRLRLAIAGMEAGESGCMLSVLLPDASQRLYEQLVGAELGVRTCGWRIAALTTNTIAGEGALRLTERTGTPDRELTFSLKELGYFEVIELLEIAEAANPAERLAFFWSLLKATFVDSGAKARIADYLRRKQARYESAAWIPDENSVNLRRALMIWRAEQADPSAAADLLARINDADQWDFAEVAAHLRISRTQLEDAIGRVTRSTDEAKRAAALVALYGTAADLETLMGLRHRDVSGAIMSYIGYRSDLPAILTTLQRSMPTQTQGMQERLRLQQTLSAELASIDTSLRIRRVELLLQGRRTWSNARSYLSPGIVLWLRQTYHVDGDFGLD